jgi:hypothetical protein
MDKIKNDFAALKDSEVAKATPEAFNGITLYLKQTDTITCSFCLGKGHNLKRCATKITLDKKFSKNPLTKIAWGSFKAKQKLEGGKKRVGKTLKLVEEEAKKAEQKR